MADESPTVSIRDFKGLISDADPQDIPDGAAVSLLNVQGLQRGALSVRKGIQKNTDYTASSPGTDDLVYACNYQHPLQDVLVTEDSAGVVHSRTGGAKTSRGTGWHTAWPLHMARARSLDLIGVNGLDRGFRWDGVTASVEQLGITAPTTAPTVTSSPGSGALTYKMAYRFIDDTLPEPRVSSFSPITTITTASAGDTFNWSTVPASSESRVTKKQLFRTLADNSDVFYLVTTITNATTSYASDSSTDVVLAANDSVNNTNPDGSPDAYAHTPPPNWASVAVQFQDRFVYGVPVEYSTGTVTTNGSTTITGSGTSWTSAMVGRYIYIAGESAPLVISAVGGATSITTTTAATTSAGGKSYAIDVSPAFRNALEISEIDLPESVPINNEVVVQVNVDDDDRMTGLIPFGSVLYVAKQRHIYRVTWVRQPAFDADVQLHAFRGLVNQRCWAGFEGVVYLLDQSGVYALSGGGGIEPISAPIQDIFRDSLDFTSTKYWFAKPVPEQHRVRFYVSYTGDSGGYPTRWLEYDVRTGDWWIGQSGFGGLGGGAVVDSGGRSLLVLVGEGDRVFTADTGTTDVVTSETRGTATAATSTTLTDSGASFSNLTGAPVGIVSGTGKGQIRRITSHTGTQLTVPAWTTTPDTTSVYLIGAVEWQWKSKVFENQVTGQAQFRSLTIHYVPTSGVASLDVRRYLDHASSPETYQADVSMGNRITARSGETDAVLDVQDENSAPGVDVVTYEGRRSSRHTSPGNSTYELRGFQGDDAIVLRRVELSGQA